MATAGTVAAPAATDTAINQVMHTAGMTLCTVTLPTILADPVFLIKYSVLYDLFDILPALLARTACISPPVAQLLIKE